MLRVEGGGTGLALRAGMGDEVPSPSTLAMVIMGKQRKIDPVMAENRHQQAHRTPPPRALVGEFVARGLVAFALLGLLPLAGSCSFDEVAVLSADSAVLVFGEIEVGESATRAA